MPLLKEWNISNTGLAAIWKVDEPEAFFNDHTGLYPDINNDIKRLEHLAGRFLLRHLEHDFPLHLIVRDEYNKPRLHNNSFFFSVSHSWPYIAAVIDTRYDAGIDIQVWAPRIMDIKQKFLSDYEQSFCLNDHRLITLAWCAKEAVYKWYGKRGLSFKNHLPLTALGQDEGAWHATINFQAAEAPVPVQLNCLIHEDFGCAWVNRVGV